MLTGFGVSCVIPMVFSMAGRSAGMSSGSAIASVSIVGYFGFLIVPPLIGSVAELAGLRWAFGLMVLFGAAITLLVQRLIPAGTGMSNRPADTVVALDDPEAPVAEF